MRRLHEKAKREKNSGIYSFVKDDEKAKRRERNEYLNAISENLLIPPDVACHAPIITIQGRQAIYIENHKKVLEYTDSEIKLQAYQTIIHIEGAGLKIAYCTKEEMKVTGVIRIVSYH